MSTRKNYAVFGLGRYGLAVTKELLRHGAEVLAVDVSQATINAAANEVPICRCADVTDPEVIRRLDIAQMDVVIIAMGSSLEGSVMATMLCKEAGVRMVIVKCANEMHGRILRRVGADKVVIPETESGIRMAKNLVSAGFVDLMELSREVSMVEMDVPPAWVGKTLLELNLRRRHSMNVVAIRQGEDVTIHIDPERPMEADMTLIVIADIAKLNKLQKSL